MMILTPTNTMMSQNTTTIKNQKHTKDEIYNNSARLFGMSGNNKSEDAHAHNEDGSHVGEEIPRLSHTIWTG